MRKYKYLNNDSAHKRDVAYHSKDIANKYVFQRSGIDIHYLVCDTIDEFYKYYSMKNPSSRMYNEVINDEYSYQKFKLDIDGFIGTNEMKYMLESVRKIFRKLTKMYKPEIFVYNISTSHHIVVTNLSFSATSCEMLANAIYERVYKQYPQEASLIDTTVYKKVQMFRLEGSTKYAQRRWKYLADTKELSPLEIFKKGIISYVDECHHINDDTVVDTMLDIGVYQPSEYNSDIKRSVKKIPKGFIARKVLDNLVVLNRIHPSFCDVCKRIHEHENAYMVGRHFFCYRAN
jgi:hypothetical protein